MFEQLVRPGNQLINLNKRRHPQFIIPGTAAAAAVGAGCRGGGVEVAAGPLVGEESEAVDGVDDEEGDPQVERHARSNREEDPRLAVGLPVQYHME